MTVQTNEDNLVLSFEFFPAKAAQQERLFWRTVGCLETLRPDFFSMTCGALGSDRQVGFDMLHKLHKESQIPVAAHLTCGGRSKAVLQQELADFRDAGVNHIVALRGDAVESSAPASDQEVCRYAEDLVELINQQTDFDVSVAAYPEKHPEAASSDDDLAALKRKLDKGASRALTQFFYDPAVFLAFRDRAAAAGIEQPIVPGILPIHDIEKVVSFSQRCGAQVPENLVDEFRVWSHDPAASRELAIAHGLALCETLKQEGVEHFHFYTLNQSDLSYEVSRLLVNDRVNSVVAA